MQYFIDANQNVYAFDDDVHVTGTAGQLTFTAASGEALSVPAALSPYTPPAPTTAQQLAAAQVAQLATLTAAYQNAIQQPVSYTSKGGVTKVYQADQGSVANLQAMLLAFQAPQIVPSGFYWVALDNTQVPFAYADMQGLANALGTQGAAAFQKLQTLKAQVKAATTPSAVQAFTW